MYIIDVEANALHVLAHRNCGGRNYEHFHVASIPIDGDEPVWTAVENGSYTSPPPKVFVEPSKVALADALTRIENALDGVKAMATKKSPKVKPTPLPTEEVARQTMEDCQEVTNSLIRALGYLHGTEIILTMHEPWLSAAPGENLKIALKRVKEAAHRLEVVERSWDRSVKKGIKARK